MRAYLLTMMYDVCMLTINVYIILYFRTRICCHAICTFFFLYFFSLFFLRIKGTFLIYVYVKIDSNSSMLLSIVQYNIKIVIITLGNTISFF